MGVVITIQLLLWAVSAWWLYRKSTLRSWIRYLYAASVFPMLEWLLVLNIYLTDLMIPELLSFTAMLVSEKWPGVVAAPFAFIAAAPLALGILLVWVKLLELLDRKATGLP